MHGDCAVGVLTPVYDTSQAGALATLRVPGVTTALLHSWVGNPPIPQQARRRLTKTNAALAWHGQSVTRLLPCCCGHLPSWYNCHRCVAGHGLNGMCTSECNQVRQLQWQHRVMHGDGRCADTCVRYWPGRCPGCTVCILPLLSNESSSVGSSSLGRRGMPALVAVMTPVLMLLGQCKLCLIGCCLLLQTTM